MSNVKKLFSSIFREQRGFFALLAINILLGVVLCLISCFSIKLDTVGVKIGYGDIGGYKDGTWTDMLVFPVLALLFGMVHAAIAVRIFGRHGDGMAKVFTFITTILLIGLYVLFFRLINEG